MSETAEKVLVVDDEDGIRKVLKRMLEDAGYEVITAVNGNQALDLVPERNPDLVLLDVKMPGKSGLEVLQELRISHPDIPVIMSTALDDIKTVMKAIGEGAYGYLNKPFNANDLVISVARALERRRLTLENRGYQLNLERKVAEQTRLLQQKVRELTALNNLFAKYLNQGFEAAEEYGRLADDITKMAKEAKSLYVQGSDVAKTRENLASGIIKAAGEIKALAGEFQARRVEVQTSRAEEQGNSE